MLSDFRREMERCDRLETDFLRILYYEFPDRYKGVYRSYEYSRLCTIIEGEKSVSVNRNLSFKYDKDEFLLIPAGAEINMEIKGSTKALVFELNTELIRKVGDKVCEDYGIPPKNFENCDILHSIKTPEIRMALNNIAGALSDKRKGREFLVDLYAQELACRILQVKGASCILNSDSSNLLNRALRYMGEDLGRSRSIREISGQFGMSEPAFCQYFKKVMGITPKEYMTNLKLERAKEIIRSETVTDTALELGYDNISHFILLFKKRYGMTPKQYKKACGQG